MKFRYNTFAKFPFKILHRCVKMDNESIATRLQNLEKQADGTLKTLDELREEILDLRSLMMQMSELLKQKIDRLESTVFFMTDSIESL